MNGLEPKIIKTLVRKKGASLALLARNAGFSSSEVQGALRRPIFWGEQIIAKFLNLHPQSIWPDRYDEEGNPKHPYASAKQLKPFSPICKEKIVSEPKHD